MAMYGLAMSSVVSFNNEDSVGLSVATEHIERDVDEETIFHAVRISDRDMIRRQLFNGVRLDNVHYGSPCLIKDPCLTHHIRLSGYSLLHVAVCHSQIAVIRNLLELGSEVNVLDSTNRTPLFLATVVDRLDVVDLLIQFGADTNIVASSKKTALMRAVTNRNCRLVSALIAAGCGVNVADATGSTALYLASMSAGDERIMQLLIKGGADVNQANKMGATPLHVAVQARQRNAINMLLGAGANVNKGDKCGRHAVHIASPGRQYLELICLLARYGADLNAVDNKGKRAIHYAIKYSNALAVKFMIMCDCDYDPAILDCPFVTKICDIYREFREFLETERSQPKSLLCLCRQTIRRFMPATNLIKIQSLDVPDVLRNFLDLRFEIREFSNCDFILRRNLERPHRLEPRILAGFEGNH